jgi:hypothetical protein
LLLLLAYNNMQMDRHFNTEGRLEKNMRSATNLVMADTSLIIGQQETSLDLFDGSADSATIKKANWGMYSFATVTVKTTHQEKTKAFFFGQELGAPLDGCLYLADRKSALSLVGETLLDGDAYLPKAGVNPGFIDQRGFAYPVLIKGSIRTSADTLPAIDERLCSLLENAGMARGEGMLPDTLVRSFFDTAKVFHFPGAIRLLECRLDGHILVVSDSSIWVGANTSLNNIILVAPSIAFESGFSGTVQAIATDSIRAQDDCHFGYPSALVLCKRKDDKAQPTIMIGERSGLSGIVLTYCPDGNDLVGTYVELGKGGQVEGYMYTAGFLNLKGRVNGAVLTNHFITRFSSSILVNYLVDATIDRKGLSSHFIGPHLFDNPRQNKIIQWVN